MGIYRMATVDIPSDVNTVLLLHGDGVDNGTVITDEKGKTATRFGNVCTKTAIKKFGTASIYLDGSSALAFANSADFNFGTGDFVVDFWCYPTSFNSATNYIFGTREGVNGTNYYFLRINDTSGHLRLQSYSNAVVSADLTTTTTLTLNAWNHVEISKASGTVYIWINGVLGKSGTAGAFTNGTNRFEIGFEGEDTDDCWYYGYLDEFRVRKGIGGHTSAFTPPTEPYAIGTVPTNTNVEIKSQFRGLSGVNRQITAQYRGYSGVNRLVFGKESYRLITDGVMQNGKTLTAGYESSQNLLATISYPAGYVNIDGYNNYRGGVYITETIDLTGYSMLKVELEYTKGAQATGICAVGCQTVSPSGGIGNSMSADTVFVNTADAITITRQVISVDVSSLTTGQYLDLIHWNSVYATTSPTYPVSAKIYNAWLE